MFQTVFADLHVHVGSDRFQNPVKISASKDLTLTNILHTADNDKGIELIGIVDCHVPNVLSEVKQLIANEEAYELSGGGIRFHNVTLLIGSELEIYDEDSQGPFHVLVFLPTVEAMEQFSAWLKRRMKNIRLSSQRVYETGRTLQKMARELEGLFIPAHVFTPFKSLYGRGVQKSLAEVLDPEKIDAIELGLSSDTHMADNVKELHRYTYLTNSDSHSLLKIGREYQKIKLKDVNFQEFAFSLRGQGGRGIVANYGMDPRLGKYYRTVCQSCFRPAPFEAQHCPVCHSPRIVNGVYDRIQQLKSERSERPKRPPYIYQVPLEYIPGLGKKTRERLLLKFGTEMNVIHHASYEQLLGVVSEKIAASIIAMRNGKVAIDAGGGGKYGRVIE